MVEGTLRGNSIACHWDGFIEIGGRSGKIVKKIMALDCSPEYSRRNDALWGEDGEREGPGFGREPPDKAASELPHDRWT